VEVNPLIAFGAGLISIFSPCVLPLLPAIVASSTDRGRYRPLAIVLGLSISFTSMGLVASAFGAVFTAYSYYLFAAAIVLIIAMGFWMLFDLHLPYDMPRLGIIDRVSRKTYDIPTEGIPSGLALGLALGIVWLPCTGPVLATILTWVAANGNIATGGLLLLISRSASLSLCSLSPIRPASRRLSSANRLRPFGSSASPAQCSLPWACTWPSRTSPRFRRYDPVF